MDSSILQYQDYQLVTTEGPCSASSTQRREALGTIYSYSQTELSLCLADKQYSCRRMVEWKYSSGILELGIRWRSAVDFTPRLFYPWYTLNIRLGMHHSRLWRCEVDTFLDSAGIWILAFQPVARRYTYWVIRVHPVHLCRHLASNYHIYESKHSDRTLFP
jgi:hypothetical protein